MSEPDADAYVVALDEGRRAIDQQREDFKTVRDRAVGLLTVGGVAAGFLGGLAQRDNAPLGYWTLVAAFAFGVLVVVAVRTLVQKEVTFPQEPKQIISWIERQGYDTATVRRTAAYYHGVNYEANSKVLTAMIRDYQIGIAFLVIEFVALMLDLRGR